MSSIESSLNRRIESDKAELERLQSRINENIKALNELRGRATFVDGLRMSSGPTETAELFPEFKCELSKLLRKYGATDLKFRLNHVDIYMNFRVSGNAYYLTAGGWSRYAMMRRVPDYESSKSGRNWNLDISSLENFEASLRDGIEHADPAIWP